MTIKPATVSEITTTAIKLLCREIGPVNTARREIGPVNTARFINQFTSGGGNYTLDRDNIIGTLSVNEIAEKARRLRKQRDREGDK